MEVEDVTDAQNPPADAAASTGAFSLGGRSLPGVFP